MIGRCVETDGEPANWVEMSDVIVANGDQEADYDPGWRQESVTASGILMGDVSSNFLQRLEKGDASAPGWRLSVPGDSAEASEELLELIED